MSRILGIDYGERRIGLAISDATGTIATPLKVVEITSLAKAIKEIVATATERGVQEFLVGMPVSLNGTRGPAALKTTAFVELLGSETTLPIKTWDERFSTVSAQQALIEGGVRREKRKGVVDKVAAQIFLQNYLDAQAGSV